MVNPCNQTLLEQSHAMKHCEIELGETFMMFVPRVAFGFRDLLCNCMGMNHHGITQLDNPQTLITTTSTSTCRCDGASAACRLIVSPCSRTEFSSEFHSYELYLCVHFLVQWSVVLRRSATAGVLFRFVQTGWLYPGTQRPNQKGKRITGQVGMFLKYTNRPVMQLT